MKPDCLFCKIVKKQIPTEFLMEDDHCVAIRDIHPQAPTHLLILPRRHLEKIADMKGADEPLMGRMHSTAVALAKKLELEDFRLVINNGAAAGQSVWHLHLHLLGGRNFSWPPG